MSRSALDTPMMRQYQAIKADHPDAIVFYRMGDFYEMFLEDAERAAPLLDIALTTRDRGKPDAVPMCGVPVHGADPHIKKLAALGYRVAICEQVEDAAAASGRRLVKRQVVEVVTPGLVGDPDGIEAARELSLLCLEPGPEAFGVAILEASTGDFRATSVPRRGAGLPPALADELQRVDPSEILVPAPALAGLAAVLEDLAPGAARTAVDPASFDLERASDGAEAASRDGTDPAERAAAGVLAYLQAHQPFAVARVSRLRRYALGDAMVVDAATRRHLELFRNAEDGSRKGTLVAQLDRTVTALGARRLARWLSYPLLDPQQVRLRQDAVAWLAERDRPRARLREALRPVRDLERLLAKAARPTATPRDLAAWRASLEALPGVAPALAEGAEEPAHEPGPVQLPQPVPAAAELLREALVDDPPAVPRGSRGAGETGYIRAGFHAGLDGLREGVHKGREWIVGLELQERERTGIPSLKIRFHPVHGYSIEVTRANLGRVPEGYERRQTLANAERFTTPELRDVEQRGREGNEGAAALERGLFEAVRRSALEHAPAVRDAADAVATLDASAALAEVARLEGWVRPGVDASPVLEIRGGRHPVVEAGLRAEGGEFVPNDTELDPATRQMVVLTGPNMSGKSTYLRQTALIALLAQMGSFVPAASARVGVVDRIFTRVGASDRLARGESTFMVEMRETAEILAHASPRSLVILDDIGRGTSTFDGLSIAWAVAEHLHDTPGLAPRTLFATHFHELTDLARTRARVVNAHFRARERGEEVVFLRQIAPGAANRSYGIQVARLAGLPGAVIERAREILQNLEGGELDEGGRPRLARRAESGDPAPLGSPAPAPPGSDQLALFARPPRPPEEDEILEALRSLDPERTTPLEALQTLAGWAARLRGGGGS